MTYAETIESLYGLRLFGAKLGLENTFKLAALAGNPQERLRFIHVAGTNGKGSTCAMLEGIYRAAGLRVGLFTSPHLIAFGERIQVNRQLISEAGIIRLAEQMKPWLKSFPEAGHPTFFEVVTVMALQYFAEQKCDLVIWETGLGGRLDATNIVTPLASVITNIQYDHQKWLGDTLDKIAFEKAGIIKPGVPVVTATEVPEALKVIKARAQEVNAPLTVVAGEDANRPPLNEITLPLLGRHQRLNAALAMAVVAQLQNTLPVDQAAMCSGLEHVFWPGRLHLVTRAGGGKVLLDGAHNPAGASALCKALSDHFPGSKPVLILGLLADKDCGDICDLLAPMFHRICLVPVGSDRTAAPEELLRLCQKAHPKAATTAHTTLADAFTQVSQEQLIVITGSLYLMGEALEFFRLSPAGKSSEERRLNEWGGVPGGQAR